MCTHVTNSDAKDTLSIELSTSELEASIASIALQPPVANTMAYVRMITPGDNSLPQTLSMHPDVVVQVANSERLATQLQTRLNGRTEFNPPHVTVTSTVRLSKTGLTVFPVRVNRGPLVCGDHLHWKNELLGWVVGMENALLRIKCESASHGDLVRVELHSPGCTNCALLSEDSVLLVVSELNR